MNDKFIGTLQQNNNGSLTFRYDTLWLSWQYSRPISLSMPLSDQAFSGNAVYNFFDNLLPDNNQIRSRIQQRFNLTSNNCFDLLASIGIDCVGALQLLPEKQTPNIAILNKSAISDIEIAAILKNYRAAPLGMQKNLDFRISIAGAQEKTALLKLKNKWYIPQKNTPTTHILKLPIGFIQHSNFDLSNSVENEWICLQIIAGYGIPAAHVEIVNFDGTKVLVVERFDRKWDVSHTKLFRLPQEDICQAFGFPSALKYEADGGPGIKAIMNLLQGSSNSSVDRYNFMKTVFLFWVMAAIDGHAKNFSIILEPGGGYRLQPIYDVISAYPLIHDGSIQKEKVKMAMAALGKNKNYKWCSITLRHWLDTAENCRFPRPVMQEIISEIFESMESVLSQIETKITSNILQHTFNSIATNMLKLRNANLL